MNDFIWFSDDKDSNRLYLRVTHGAECLYAGASTEEDAVIVKRLVPSWAHCGGSEHWSDGSRNIFVRDSGETVIGVVRVRP